MPNTFVKIASVTVGAGGAANIDFTSIPSTYTDLMLMTSVRMANADIQNNLKIAFNGSSASMTVKRLYGTGTSVFSDSLSQNQTGNVNAANSTANTFGSTSLYIPNYAGSNNKSSSSDGVAETNATNVNMGLYANLWSNTAAINQITLTGETTANFLQYSTATLYGIKNS
jgi:hypothetical protein